MSLSIPLHGEGDLRQELVSNASDALEKERHLQLTEKSVYDEKLELEVNITTDDKAKTFTIRISESA